ncbi:hypothetical protein Acid345_3940 [Candidatus Koribacter versatilis Ellin345]|uniref:Lipoprotein n=1 Tax=Koribacter versatilis (strain Ellin345) TaxID=204669 RepID=Q1IJL0_KORVE|nr:hypothetical protein [Candidatus Koribacter versatilis]ABF42940.1 hypothetical protein Acid345_3940 [Candidatus Koribacter versatilis Ellin345]
MKNYGIPFFSVVIFAVSLLVGCGSSPLAVQPAPPLSAENLNLIFVSSEDLAHHASGDVSEATANLTNQGLQRVLLNAAFLRKNVLANQNVNGIYALEPMTHLQTASQYPDMAALEMAQQFAVLNQVTLSSDQSGGTPFTGQNFPINASYSPNAVPPDVLAPLQFCPACQGLDFSDVGGDNEAVVSKVLTAKTPGFYVFVAPWETVRELMVNADRTEGYALQLPEEYPGPNTIYAIAVAPSGSASLVDYDTKANPGASYPTLPAPVPTTTCTVRTPESVTVTGGVDGAVVPANANTDEVLYMIRHAEAHPQGYWSDNNYVAAGNWRALALPSALEGKSNPDEVWSGDPSSFGMGTMSNTGQNYFSGVAPPLTVVPYVIAKDLPYHLVAGFDMTAAASASQSSQFFFTGGRFSQRKVLLGWMYVQNQQIINALFASYYPNGGAPVVPTWSPLDYDSLWTVTFDGQGNFTVDYSRCEGIDSAALPATAPQF